MFFDNNFVNLFEIGDYVKFRNIRGVVIEFSYPASSQPGYYKILKDDGNEFIDYHYVFNIDIERIRQNKLKELGI